jgi:hypothetical protein
MISQDRDYEDILRDALRAAAESVEPAGNGLERIRRRSHSRRSARTTLTKAADWLRLYRIRLSVRLESFRWELSQRGIGQPPTGPDHDGRRPVGKAAARLGPAAAWLKPAFAVAAVVAVVVIGVVTLNRMQEAVIAPTGSSASPGQQQTPASAAGLASPGPWTVPIGVSTSLPAAASKKKSTLATPAVACTPTPAPSPSATPSASASVTPTPTPSDTSTTSPTPTPSVTGGSPSDSPTTGGTEAPSANDTNTTADAMFAPDIDGSTSVSCGSTVTSPKATASS